MRRRIFILWLLLVSLAAAQDSSEPVRLEWKLSPGETVSYWTVMDQVDPAKLSIDWDQLGGVMKGEDPAGLSQATNLFKDINKALDGIQFVTHLTSAVDGVVDIVLEGIPSPKAESEDGPTATMARMMEGVQFRGSMYKTGGIQTFWVRSNQRNLIALLFDLPDYPVRVGDGWTLDVNLIANDQNFVCDSTQKSIKVTPTELRQRQPDTVAVLRYDVLEEVKGAFQSPLADGPATPTAMKFTHQAVAEFSVTQGRWLSCEGLMTMSASGLMDADQRTKFSLIPVAPGDSTPPAL